jgi:hypothetical protein
MQRRSIRNVASISDSGSFKIVAPYCEGFRDETVHVDDLMSPASPYLEPKFQHHFQSLEGDTQKYVQSTSKG